MTNLMRILLAAAAFGALASTASAKPAGDPAGDRTLVQGERVVCDQCDSTGRRSARPSYVGSPASRLYEFNRGFYEELDHTWRGAPSFYSWR
jgi:hypothetical protein